MRFDPETFGPVAAVANADGAGGGLIVCEHASARMPVEFGALGLRDDLLLSHIAWDPGAMDVATGLSRRLDAPLVHCRASRLLYDCNRPPEAAAAVPTRSEAHDIPGNQALDPAARSERVQAFYRPFEALLAKTIANHPTPPAIVTIHSFTPVFHGERRDVEIGVLHDEDSRLADAVLASASSFDTRRNAPYGPEDGVTHTLRRHAIPAGLPNVMLEIRNDLIATPDACDRMAGVLASWLEAAFARLGAAPAEGAA